jgi:hypothetical protein
LRDEAAVPLSRDLAAVMQANELVRQGKAQDATALAASIDDPVAAKLVEWALLRRADGAAGFERYVAFIRANPDWPSVPLMRRRAEARLWQERRDGATVRRFVGSEPMSAIGRLALARVEMAEGDRAGAESKVRAVWRSEPLSAETETAVLAAFPDMLTRADHVARMDRRIGAKEFGAAMRAAKRLGDDQVAIVKACSAAEAKSNDGGKLLDTVRTEAREDLGYTLCRLHWLMRNDTPGSNVRGRIVTPKGDVEAAAKLMLAASPHAAEILYKIGEGDLALSFVSDLAKEAATAPSSPGSASSLPITTMPRRCCSSARRRSRAVCQWTCTPSRTSACPTTIRSVPSSIAALSMRSCARKAASIRATCRRPRQSG